MVDLVTLTSGDAELRLAPELGGGIAQLNVGGKPVLRPFQGDVSNLFSLASNVLVPFSNRISGGGFSCDGRFHAIEPNLVGEAFPIHGDGFQKPWSATSGDGQAQLTLIDGRLGPWRYRAQQTFALSETAATIVLKVTNTSDLTLPFGGGFHPWFPRTPETQLSFVASSVWTEDKTYLPVEEKPLDQVPGWDFAKMRALPDGWINNAYCGWGRNARIVQGEEAVSCSVTSSEALNVAMVHSPGADADFFCFEPVSHSVDAHNLPNMPGLEMLPPGVTWQANMTIDWSGSN